MLRAARVSYPQLYTADSYCCSRLRAGASGWWIAEGRAFVSINSDGLRDREHVIPKPPNVFRVAILGDSFTEALQVDLHDTYWKVAEKSLQTRQLNGEPEIEFVNFGVMGHGTAQELLMLRHYVWKYDPDLVLVAFCHNDIQNNSRKLGGGEMRPYYVLRDNALHLDTSFRESDAYLAAHSQYENWKATIVNCSYTLQLLKQVKMNWHLRHDRMRATQRGAEDVGSDFDFYKAPESETAQMAWNVTERLLVEIRSDVVHRNRRFGLLAVTTPLQVNPNLEVRTRALEKRQAQDLFYVERRLTELAERYDFPILTLAEPMQKQADSQDLYLHGFANTEMGTGHWNEAGHALAGEHLAEWLATEVIDGVLR